MPPGKARTVCTPVLPGHRSRYPSGTSTAKSLERAERITHTS